jgi:hypothetical protein
LHLDRITAIERDDPSQVIGSTKELVESTTKLVLHQLGVPVRDSDDLPAMVRQTQDALAIRPSSVRADAADGVKMSWAMRSPSPKESPSCGTEATGPVTVRPCGERGLASRHARLAINAARLWCEFVLEALADERTPWSAVSGVGNSSV